MDYFGFISADWHEFEGLNHIWYGGGTLFIKGAVVSIGDYYGGETVRGAPDTADEMRVTFDLRANTGEDGHKCQFDVYFAPGTFPLPNGHTQADAEEVILESFAAHEHPPGCPWA